MEKVELLPPHESRAAQRQRMVVAVVYIAVMFMAIMDTTIVNVALPTIGRDLHARIANLGLVSVAYLVSLTIFIPASGWWGDWVGGRRALLSALGVFTLSSALCGLSSNVTEIVVFRISQGAGGAIMMPVGLAMLFRVYPPAERVKISSTLALFTALAPALGPILGGVLTTWLSWRLVFLVNVPIGLAAFVFGYAALDSHHAPHPGRLDVLSLIFSAIGLGSTMYGIVEGPPAGWSSPPVIVSLFIGLTLLVAVVVVELRADNPFINLRLLHNHLFAATTSVYGLGSISYLGALFLAALFFQSALGLSALQCGLMTFPSAVGVMTGGQVVTRVLYRRFGPRRIIAAGLLVAAGSLIVMACLDTETPRWLMAVTMFCLGLGISFAFVSSQASSMTTLTKAQVGKASTIFNASKQLGGAIGVALLNTVLVAASPAHQHGNSVAVGLRGYHKGFFVAAVVAVMAMLVALTIRDTDVASTLAPHKL
ncbi:TPA: multidrug efflux MFS transporter [Burkholderia vietnamiensis]|nr:multidrug efflux MFS transporter [Burkholderia vietnamiensis]